MVERSFRTLKALLRAHENPTNWIDNLSLVLLGLRSTVKEDIEVSSAHMVYGGSLFLPGQFLDHDSMSAQPTSQYVQQLVNFMEELQVTPPKHHNTPFVYFDKNLKACSHVIFRIDATKGALSPRYSGPHKVLQRQDKYFTLAQDGKLPNVSIDRLKAAHLPNMDCIESKSTNVQIKSSLYLLNTLSGVTSERCPSPQLCAKAHTIKVPTVASHWQRMGDLIGSGMNPIPPAPETNVLPLVLSGRYQQMLTILFLQSTKE